MACRGVFFAISIEQGDVLYDAFGNDVRLKELIGEIEEEWDKENLTECDKSWDAMHRLLTDGQLDYGSGDYPYSHVVLGPCQLYQGDDYILSLVSPETVVDIAAVLKGVTKDWFDNRYQEVVPSNYALEYGDDDREYTWSWFKSVRDLYTRASACNRAVIFTVDQ